MVDHIKHFVQDLKSILKAGVVQICHSLKVLGHLNDSVSKTYAVTE